MKNLKLLCAEQVKSLKGNTFCHDLDGFVYFGDSNEIFCLNNLTNEITSCAILECENQSCNSVIGMEYIYESSSIFIASSSGDLHLYNLLDNTTSNVGMVETKIEDFSWSPDQELLILLTGSNTLLMMTKEFDAIIEKSLCPEEFGEKLPINVGWGSKTTQFHGSEGKGAAHIKEKEPHPALPYDDRLPRSSWRGDGEYFVTSSIHPQKGFRQLRIWNQEAILQFTSEIIENLEEPISWRPSGNIIACSQQCANKHKIIFFEKNGLQHGEFTLPFQPNTHKVVSLCWSSDSKVLLVGSTELTADPIEIKVMLYSSSNYHWYLKQSFQLSNTGPLKSVAIKWAVNEPYTLHCYNQSSGEFHSLKWTWVVSSNSCFESCNDALVASIDKENILISSFDKMVVPPPMCAYMFSMSSPVQSVFFSPDRQTFACYLGNCTLAFFGKESHPPVIPTEVCKLKLIGAGGNGFKSKIKPYSFSGSFQFEHESGASFQLCHWTWVHGNKLICVSLDSKSKQKPKYFILLFTLSEEFLENITPKVLKDLAWPVKAICTSKNGKIVAVQNWNGEVYKLFIGNEDSDTVLEPWLNDDGSSLQLPQTCPDMAVLTLSGNDYVMGLSDKFNLYCNNTLILSKCTSYYIHDEFLLTTTIDHYLKSFSINKDVLSSVKNSSILPSEVQSQKIEKGAKIVIAPSKSTKVILQMPRGNLETVHPRALVLSAICKHLDCLAISEAFELSKIHRIDLNILYDYNPKVFLGNVEKVVDQIPSASDLNLILANLKDEDVRKILYPNFFNNNAESQVNTNDKTNAICDAFRNVLEKKDNDKYHHTLMATYAKKNPPELDKALLRLKDLKESSNSVATQDLVDSSLNFLLYLVDVNELIDVALGTYDLETTIMVAQKSQKDPKEFLPFYNELQVLEENYRKYKIDMHLKKYKKALQHISKCDNHFDECIQLIKEQRLYIDALYLFPSSSDRFKVIWKEYGNYLLEKRYYDEAGLVFTRCGDHLNALTAYNESENWQSALCAAANLNYSDDRLIYLCQELALKLKSSQKYIDASYLLEHYIKDIEESIVTLIEGYEWNSAILMMSKYRRQDIAKTHLEPALKDYQYFLISHLKQTFEDFNKHLERLKHLRTQKKKELEQPSTFKYAEDDLFSDVRSVSEAASSHAESKQMSGSIVTRKSSKSRRKQKLKKYKLREGAPDEDLALMVVLSEIVTKIDSLKDNMLSTLKALVHFAFDSLARELQQQICCILSSIEDQMPYIWNSTETMMQSTELKFGPDSTSNSIATALQKKQEMPVSLSQDPELTAPPWRNIDIALQMFK